MLQNTFLSQVFKKKRAKIDSMSHKKSLYLRATLENGRGCPGNEVVLGNFCPILLADSPLRWALEKENRQVRRLDRLINGSIETIHLNDNNYLLLAEFSVRTVNYGPSQIDGKKTRIRNLQYGPKQRG